MMFKLSSWDLKDVKPENVEKSIEKIESHTKELESRRKQFTEKITKKEFIDFLKSLENLETEIAKLYSYFGLKFTENTSDHKISAQKSIIEQYLAKVSNRLLFFGLWFKDLPEEKAKELIKSSGDYHYFLETIRRTKPYALKEPEEKILTLKNITGSSALVTVYEILTSQFEFEFRGKLINQNELRKFFYDPNHEVRKKAYEAYFSRFLGYKNVISEIYKQLVNDWREENIGLRGHKDPISVRNIGNDLPDESIKALLKVCERNQKLFHRFFELKRKELRLKKLTRYDVYAPLEKKSEKISYDKAVKMVLDTFGEFSTEFMEAAKKVIDAKHIHSKLQKNKNPGAFCAGPTKTLLPFVLLNYTETLRDVSVLAHELGHAIHDVLSMDQTEFGFSPGLPLAETASTFGEMILLDKLVNKRPEKARPLIFSRLDNFYATIIRQATITQFEIEAHKMIEEGKHLGDLNKAYLKLLKKQLGPGIEVDNSFGSEWLCIPHIYHTPFYCYAYSFGNLFSLSLYETYKKEGDKFVPKFLEMLSKGGGESPIKLTNALGVDISSEEFWERGFEVIQNMIEELENSTK